MSVTDVTAIWNTNTFFAYVISVKVIGLEWEARRLAAVVLATLGVIAVVYHSEDYQRVPVADGTKREKQLKRRGRYRANSPLRSSFQLFDMFAHSFLL
ncbi:hypothetical protein E1B28_001060 [Marasmius oreades]|uniref:EamA domain-containing protein n=1 Tax=Marasmius oreades TaxID=181124 RepID=A0A9P8AF55_9AGAR|nr:uncharacterized protein E1B28_001060 [Marasmius oreades]KAG7099193.1 hypothetical protein E1B28_001060 [Marasmius oreades]